MQMKDVEAIARELMSNAGTIREEFTTAKHLEHVKPMFQVYKNNKIDFNRKEKYLFLLESMVTMFSSL